MALRAAGGDDRLRGGVGDGRAIRRRVLRSEHDRERDRSRRRRAEDPPVAPADVPAVEEVPDRRHDREDREQDEPGVIAAPKASGKWPASIVKTTGSVR